jgi:hypothetical protein
MNDLLDLKGASDLEQPVSTYDYSPGNLRMEDDGKLATVVQQLLKALTRLARSE